MSAPVIEHSGPVVDEQQSILDTPPTSADSSVEKPVESDSTTDSEKSEAEAEAKTDAEAEKPKPLPTEKDFPALGSGASRAASNKVAWGPNVKPAASPASKSTSPSPSSSNSSIAKPMRSKTIQEAFSLDLQSQLSISKPEFSRIVQSVKQTHGVSVESTLSKTSRTFLISGVPDRVYSARRELVKRLTKPVTSVIEVPSKTRAAIIGSGGKMIREIYESTGGVKIDVAKEVNEESYDSDLDDHTVNITLHGDFDSVNSAKEKILAIVKEETKNASLKLEVENKKLIPFIDLDAAAIAEGIKVQFFKDSGDIVLSGPRDDAKASKVAVANYLNELDSKINEKRVKIPAKFQFLINDDEIKEKFNVVVILPTTTGDEQVSFIGNSSDIEEAITFARESSKAYLVESLEISKAHGKNVAHSKNVALYFAKYNALSGIQNSHPNVRIALPGTEELAAAEQVTVKITAKKEFAEEMKAVRKEVINLVNELTPSEVLIVDDLDYELFAKDIKHILSGHEEDAAFVQLGDSYPNSDTVLLVAKVSDEDFKPSEEEIKNSLEKVNAALNPLRNKQSNLASKTFELTSEVQDSLFSTSAVTLNLILEEVAQEGGHVQFKLHTPTADEITIRGDDKAVKVATKAVDSIVSNPSSKSKLKFEIPTNTVSRLIGNKGSNLSQIREKFQCSVDIPQEGEGDSTEVTVTGLLYNLEHAKTYIVAEAKKWADIVTKELIVPSNFQRNLIGAQGSYRNRLQEKYNVRIQFPREGEVVTIRGPSRGVTKAHEELKALLDFEIENGHKSIIKVPTEHVPRVIGRNGDMINDIRADYGVELNFLQKTGDAKAQETGEVELEIIGSRQAIKDATKRIEAIVSEAANNTSVTLEIDPKYHRDIVGPGGSVLREMISKAGGDEIKNKSVDVPNANSGKNEITVQGPKSFVNAVVKEIESIVEERESSVTKELDIPTERQGALVGPGGMIRRQLESEFHVRLQVPNKGDTKSKVQISGLPSNIEACEKKILNEIIKDNFDLEIEVPAAFHEFVSERGAFMQKLRVDYFINVKHGNSGNRANKLSRASLNVPAESARGTPEEGIKFTTEEISSTEDSSAPIPWRLSYEPVDLSDILGEEAKKDEPNKEEVLEKAAKLIKEKIELAPTANVVGYVWFKDPKKFNKIVGPGGSNIKKIRESTGTIINVPRKTDKVNDVVYIKGTREGVEKAGELVMAALKK